MEMSEYPKWVYREKESKIVNSKEEMQKGWYECPTEAIEKAKKASK